MRRREVVRALSGLVASCAGLRAALAGEPKQRKDKVVKSDEDWKKALTPEQYQILRKKGTERAFTGAYWNNHDKGTYLCAGCGAELFGSDQRACE